MFKSGADQFQPTPGDIPQTMSNSTGKLKHGNIKNYVSNYITYMTVPAKKSKK